jgi:Asparagine synthase
MNWQRSFVRARTGKVSPRLCELYSECTDEERRLSSAFFERYPVGQGTGTLTAFAGILQDPGPLAFAKRIVGTAGGDLCEALEAELAGGGEVAVAVSGGIDSWVLAALLKRLGYRVRGWYLESGVEGYCEREQVLRCQKALGIPCEHIRVSAADFVESAAEFVAVTETPIYNLHPVSKLLLARGLARNGVTSVVTGDGADQVMRRDWDCDLLPLTLTCFRAAGIRVIAPFLSERVVSWCTRPYLDKQPLRALGRLLGVPDAPKHPTLFPVGQVGNLRPIANRPARVRDNSPGPVAAVLEYTTELLLQTLETPHPCAASAE